MVAAKDQELAVDVNYARLSDWLVMRKLMPQDWRKKLALVQVRATSAVKAVDSKHSAGYDFDNVDHSMCKELLDKVVEAGGAESARGIFGGRGGVAGELEAVIKAYERNSLHLGEISQILTQYTDYEVPLIRKEKDKSQQQIADLERKEGEHKRSISTATAAFAASCKTLGVSGDSVRSELCALPKELPPVFQTATKTMKGDNMMEAIQYYSGFMTYAHTSAASDPGPLLPTLQELRASGEYVQGTLPSMSSQHEADPGQVQTGGSSPEINWDMCGVETPSSSSGGINWDISAADATDSGAAVEINWDVGAVHVQDNEDAAGGGGSTDINWDIGAVDPSNDSTNEAVDIDWDIGVSAGDEAPVEINWDIGVGGGGAQESSEGGSMSKTSSWEMSIAADGEDGVSMIPSHMQIMSTEFRNKLLSDLLELSAFLAVRKGEAATGKGVEVTDPSLQQTEDSLSRMLEDVTAVIDALTCRRTQDLLLIQTSGRYLDRMVQSLERKREQSVKLRRALMDMDHKKDEIRGSLIGTSAKEKRILARMSDLKAKAEAAMSKQQKGRPVNIIGEINKLI